MSIFGFEEKKGYDLESLTNKVRELQQDLEQRITDLQQEHYLLKTSISDKRVITIVAERKGGIKNGDLFSFGNGGKFGGYVCMLPGKIMGMGLSCVRKKDDDDDDDVTVAIIINGKETQGYDITITRPSSHDNFSIPLSVEAGDVVNFKCKSDNADALNTVASLNIDLLID
jgi:hypothetical protein